MKVSIITVCYNRKATIAQSIESVLNQDYPNIEYIVIDGNSSDGTQNIIESYSGKITQYISERDKGMYDAINKGLKLATGDIVGLMHSDDVFYDSKVVSKIVNTFNTTLSADAVYGDGIYVTNDANEKIVRNRIGGQFNFEKLKSGWLPLHPTVYIKKSVIEKLGYYNLDFKIASDTEFLLRYLYKHKINIIYLNEYIVKMKMGGLSTNYKRVFEVLSEDYRIYKYHNISAFKTVFQKKFLALTQYLK
ncbi:glycosyltransferase [Flavobacterium sp. ANB]|uniref:glycosyltransferase family 2 protein n=1 Tax=unclassified Flavobacterium TaxID=196869 RepID=UPI0012B8FD4B|nr:MULTISPECIES: glycosyltransferase family 2 protein [unclassified Flavobacterium]MBF4518053.1 glycosyltransferase [Flavobacterium sp. ANB]MTD71203.1 glycosyltransferase [Flavobacterium sp. LC2016-13]